VSGPNEETQPLGSFAAPSSPELPPVPEKAPDRLQPVDVARIRARARPRAVLFAWAYELVAAFVIAVPLQAWAIAVFCAHPDGDAIAFQPG
jgi:hypothetical protein